MISFEPKDVSHLDTFAPQVALKQINDLIRAKARQECFSLGHVPVPKKLGEINDPQFEHLTFGFQCRMCGDILKPVLFESVSQQ